MKPYVPTIAALAIAPGAHAEISSFYAGIAYERLNSDAADLDAVVVTGGFDLNSFLGAEISAAAGISGDDAHVDAMTDAGGAVITPAVGYDYSLNSRFDLVGVAKLQLTGRARLTAKAGLSRYDVETKASYEATGTAPAIVLVNQHDGIGFIAGIGGEYDILPGTSVTAAYTYYDEQGVEGGAADGFRLGLKRRF